MDTAAFSDWLRGCRCARLRAGASRAWTGAAVAGAIGCSSRRSPFRGRWMGLFTTDPRSARWARSICSAGRGVSLHRRRLGLLLRLPGLGFLSGPFVLTTVRLILIWLAAGWRCH